LFETFKYVITYNCYKLPIFLFNFPYKLNKWIGSIIFEQFRKQEWKIIELSNRKLKIQIIILNNENNILLIVQCLLDKYNRSS